MHHHLVSLVGYLGDLRLGVFAHHYVTLGSSSHMHGYRSKMVMVNMQCDLSHHGYHSIRSRSHFGCYWFGRQLPVQMGALVGVGVLEKCGFVVVERQVGVGHNGC